MNARWQRAQLQSTTLARAEYNPQAEQLVLHFHDGSRYVYSGVLSRLFTDLLLAPSQGTFFNREIRNRYPYARIT